MEQEEFVNRLLEGLTKFPGKINIIDQQVDINVQLKYFDKSRKVFKKEDKKSIDELILDLENVQDTEKQQEILLKLSMKSDVKAFRAIEKFEQTAKGEMLQWAKMASAEAKMLLEGELLGENQIFISTGLGGLGSSFRYFIVLFANSEVSLADFQCKIIKNELDFLFREYSAKMEEIEFINNFVTMTALIPLETPINILFKRAIESINEFGNFMSYNFLINNAKRMTPMEIKDFIEHEKDRLLDEEEDDEGIEQMN